jgi:hypothetical protein
LKAVVVDRHAWCHNAPGLFPSPCNAVLPRSYTKSATTSQKITPYTQIRAQQIIKEAKTTLRAVALVCRAMAPIVQERFFHTVSLHCEKRKYPLVQEHFELLEVLNRRATLGTHMRGLHPPSIQIELFEIRVFLTSWSVLCLCHTARRGRSRQSGAHGPVLMNQMRET